MLINDPNQIKDEKQYSNPLDIKTSPSPPRLYKMSIIELKWVALLKPLGKLIFGFNQIL